MTLDDFIELFEKYDDDFLQSDFVGRKDLKAFNILNSLAPSTRDIVDHAEHDQIWLGVNIEELSEVVSEEQVKELIQLGIFLWEGESLSMFV